MLRKHFPSDGVNAALDLIDLRKRAAKKFRLANEMFFTRESLEQASGEVISSYRAERFEAGSSVLDLACGIGGDTISLARRCHVTAVDYDPVRLGMAKRNIEVYGLSDRVEFVQADVTTIPLVADAVFLDPSRRINGRRIKSLADMSPSLDFIHELVTHVPNVVVKLSPATNDDELTSLNTEIEFISESGECKEAVVWFGGFSRNDVSAVILPQRAVIRRKSTIPAPVKECGQYLYEPDPAVIRSHTVDYLASQIDAWRLSASIPYLSSDSYIETPFASCYEILYEDIFNIKDVNKYIRDNRIGRAIIKKRGVPFEPEDIAKKLKFHGTKEITFIFTTISDRIWVFACNRITD
ncbi:MAG: THUMP-like domain-containing protein [Armatimonadota bacterium]